MRLVVSRRASEQQAAARNTVARFETGILTTAGNQAGLAALNAAWVSEAMAHTKTQRLILDLDSSESPVHGQQEGAKCNGHYGSVCYHPLFCFNQFGDCEGAVLREGNVSSAEGWRELLARVGFTVTNRTDPPQGVVHLRNGRGTCEQWIKEGKHATGWARLSCHRFLGNAVRLALFVLAYNLANVVRRLVLPEEMARWSLTTLRGKLAKIGARLTRHARRLVLQMAEVAIPRGFFGQILNRIRSLSPVPTRPGAADRAV